MKTTQTVAGVEVNFEKTTASYRAPGQRKTYKTAQWIALDVNGKVLADGCATRREAVQNATLAIEVSK